MDTLAHKRFSTLVASCDRYHLLWPIWYENLKECWTDPSYPVFLGTNNSTFKGNGLAVKTAYSTLEKSWSETVVEWLDQIPSKYVLLLLDDFILKHPIDYDKLESLIDVMEEHNSPYLRIFTLPGPSKIVDKSLCVGTIARNEPYLISLQASLWKVDFLKEICKPGESPWQFEIYGSERARHFIDQNSDVDFLTCYRKRPVIYYEQLIEGGVVPRTRLWQIKKGQKLLSDWPRMPIQNDFLQFFKFYLSRVIYSLPTNMRISTLQSARLLSEKLGFGRSYGRKTRQTAQFFGKVESE
jgi:hypothetical protein